MKFANGTRRWIFLKSEIRFPLELFGEFQSSIWLFYLVIRFAENVNKKMIVQNFSLDFQSLDFQKTTTKQKKTLYGIIFFKEGFRFCFLMKLFLLSATICVDSILN